jgi:primosomal protein N' (replication factor Y)
MPSPQHHARARTLRREPTEAEALLWRLLRARAVAMKFRRQHPVPPFVVDFACVAARVVVELDGGQHGRPRDAARDAALAARGWTMLRYWNNDVLANPEGVIADILCVAGAAHPPGPR